ncbi:hypothetical protein [Massilia putida]|uniref:hypothetical protein n=1 Tax=Massilia putida TaxID=1141883 RepID=UPI00351CEE69
MRFLLGVFEAGFFPASSSTSPASGHGSVPCGRQSWVRLSSRAGDLSVGRQ